MTRPTRWWPKARSTGMPTVGSGVPAHRCRRPGSLERSIALARGAMGRDGELRLSSAEGMRLRGPRFVAFGWSSASQAFTAACGSRGAAVRTPDPPQADPRQAEPPPAATPPQGATAAVPEPPATVAPVPPTTVAPPASPAPASPTSPASPASSSAPATPPSPDTSVDECKLIAAPGEPVVTVGLQQRIDPSHAPHPANDSERAGLPSALRDAREIRLHGTRGGWPGFVLAARRRWPHMDRHAASGCAVLRRIAGDDDGCARGVERR